MENRIAQGVSVLFHPIFLPFYVLLYLMNMNDLFAAIFTSRIQLILLATVVLTTILCPLLILFFLHRRNLVRSFFLNQREERIYPLLTMAIFYYITYYVMKGITASLFFNFYMLGATLLAVVALIISFYYKISLHMLSWGGCLGMLFGLVISFGFDMFWPVSVTIAIVG
ncbi:MAG: hypothetical protein Q8867_07015, partial [Bacteroidota bacterium]|nr:hypothetical protein [Bacteroidota bacterium]